MQLHLNFERYGYIWKPFTFGLSTLTLFVLSGIGVSIAQVHTSQKQQDFVSTPTSIRQILLTVEEMLNRGKVVDVQQGEHVQLIIKGDTEGVYHLHGYNLMAVLNDDNYPSIFFQADYTGRYPLVLHKRTPLLDEQEITIAYIEIKSQ